MLEEIHIVLHTHSDIGFTHDQPVVWELHCRIIDEALKLIERDAADGLPEAAAFKWTCETWLPVLRWWRQASVRNRERLLHWQRAGRIEVTALPLHLAPLYDMALHAEINDSLRAFCAETGLEVDSAMNCDVNGQHWYLADLLINAGVRGYSTAINTHFGHCPLHRPNLFRWQAPSGRFLPAYSGFVYGFANRFNAPCELKQTRLREEFLPRLEARLREAHWQLPVILLQGVHAFGDNGSAPVGFSESVQRWNASGGLPKLRISTMRQWWAAVEPFLAKLPIHGGDWTDSWNFGAGSAAREMAVAKRAQGRLYVSDVLSTVLPSSSGKWLQAARERHRPAAVEALLHWTEHTWGADCGIGEPYSEDTDTQWNHKAHQAYTARSLCNLLRRDSMAALAGAIAPEQPHTGIGEAGGGPAHFVVFNPLPYACTISGMLPSSLSPKPRGGVGDQTSGALYAERRPDWDPLQNVGMSGAWLDQLPQYLLPPLPLWPFEYRSLPASAMAKVADVARPLDQLTFTNGHLRIELDPIRGGLRSLRLLAADSVELISGEAGLHFGAHIRERINAEVAPAERGTLYKMDWESAELVYPDGWNSNWPAVREVSESCRQTKAHWLPDGFHVAQQVDLGGGGGMLDLKVFLPHDQPWLEISASWIMGMETEPQGHYIALPFDLPGAGVRIDLGGLHMDPEANQLAGVTNDFFTTGRWVDFNNGSRGVTIAAPENPLCQLGGFRFGRNLQGFELERALYLGWVANNYWETNFRAHQPGKVSARYRVYPYIGEFDAAAAHRRGACAAFPLPQVHSLAGCAKPDAVLPPSGTLFCIEDADTGGPTPVQLIALKRGDHGGSLVRLFNDSPLPLRVRVKDSVVECLPRRLVEVRLD